MKYIGTSYIYILGGYAYSFTYPWKYENKNACMGQNYQSPKLAETGWFTTDNEELYCRVHW